VGGGVGDQAFDVTHRVNGDFAGQIIDVGRSAPGRLAGMGFDQDSTLIQLYERPIRPGVDVLTDPGTRDRIEALRV
jgi:hypothetical protein